MSIRVSVDVVIFTVRDAALHVLLVRRARPPFAGRYAIPGGFVEEDEPLEAAARRELAEETGVRDVSLAQLYAFGDPGRDPRGRVVTVAYFALVAADRTPVTAGSDAADARWFPVAALPPLAFDHGRIVACAVERLRRELESTTVASALLSATFTLGELQAAYEAILGRRLDRPRFRRTIARLRILTPLRRTRRTGRQPGHLYRFSAARSATPKGGRVPVSF